MIHKNRLVQVYSPTSGYYYIKDRVSGKILKKNKIKVKNIPIVRSNKTRYNPTVSKSLYRIAEDAVFTVLSKES